MGDYLSSDLLTRALFTSENWVIMASNEATSVRNEPEPVRLTESDIPGAKFTRPIDSYTVTELKWWLLCRGVKMPTSWSKKQLISRYTIVLCSDLKPIIPS